MLPKSLQPFAKAIAPAVLTIAGVLIDWLANGSFDKQTLTIAVTGLVTSVVVYFVPNAQPMVEPTAKPPTKRPKPSAKPKA